MSSPRRYLTRMVIFLVAASAASVALLLPLSQAFLANAPLNGLIVAVLVFGILYVFRQVWTLFAQVSWLEAYQAGEPGVSAENAPRLMAPMATMLGERQGRLSLSALSLRSILDGVSARLDESRDITRYMIGLLIFLGLLGTFWGLLETVRAVARVISELQATTGGDAAAIFRNLTTGLEAPLAGMGTAFSSSLFGLAGSLMLGFLDLQANQAQNRFYNDLEEWLSGATRLSGGGVIEGEHTVPAYIQALLETTADSLDNLQRTISQGEESRAQANATLMSLAARLTTLSDQMKGGQELMVRLAENQVQLQPVLERLANMQAGGFDDTTRSHIRNMDVYLARMLEEISSGRTQLVQEIRAEIRLLARTMAALAEEADR